MALWRLYYHLIWATKERQPLITPKLETQLYGYIIGKADKLGSIIHAIGGIEDHIHLVASIPPRLSISDFVQNIKGSSAHYLNHLPSSTDVFSWQRGYGIFSLGSKQLEQAVTYVENQKEHHFNLIPRNSPPSYKVGMDSGEKVRRSRSGIFAQQKQ